MAHGYREITKEDLQNLKKGDSVYINSILKIVENCMNTKDNIWEIYLKHGKIIYKEGEDNFLYIKEKINKTEFYRKIKHEEFLNLKYDDRIYIKIADNMIERTVRISPYYDEEKEKFILRTFKPRTNYYEEEIYIKEYT